MEKIRAKTKEQAKMLGNPATKSLRAKINAWWKDDLHEGLDTEEIQRMKDEGEWITDPDNNFIEDRCGGSDRYGYWYDL